MPRPTRFLVPTVCICSVGALAAPITKESLSGPIRPEQRKQSEANLEKLVKGMHAFNDEFGPLPTNRLGKDKKPLLSWRVQILPFLTDGKRLYDEFKLDEPWDSDHNKKLIAKMPSVYAPVRGEAKLGETFYQTVGGSHGLIRDDDPISVAVVSVLDGTQWTLMIVEAAKPVVWTKPEDLVFDGKEVPALGGMFDGAFTAATVSGDVYRIRKGVDADVLRRLIDPKDGRTVDLKDAIEAEDKK